MQWPVVNILFQEKEASQPKRWIQGDTKIGPVLEVATSYLHGKYGVEIRISSVNRDNTHFWVRISHGSNRFVMNLNNNEQEIPEVQLAEYALKLDAKDFACRSKAQAKPQRRELAGSSPRTVPIEKRTWTDVEPGKYSLSDFIKENLQKHFLYCPHWSDIKWKSSMTRGGGGNKKIFQCCSDSSGTIVHLRGLQGNSGCNLIDPTLQDNVIIQSNFFEYISHVGCAINLHSIINSGLIPGGQILSNRQTVFFLPVDPMDKNHKDLDTIDLEAPRHAQYMHIAWKIHHDAVFWVDINLAMRKGLKFYQTRSNAIILHETIPACCIPKAVWMETGEVIYEKVYMSPRPPPKISLKHEWKRELGSEHAQRPEGQVVQPPRSFQQEVSNRPNQFQIQVVIDRGNPLLELTREPCKTNETRPVLRRSM